MSIFEKITTNPERNTETEKVIIGQTEKDDGYGDCCGMTYKQRFIGFLICMILGFFISLMSLFGAFDIVLRPTRFAVLYSIGNVLQLTGSLMLWGPVKQVKDMYSTVDRGISSTTYILCIIGTILVCIFYPKWYLVIPLVLVQFIAGVWYTLSHFPRIRNCLLRCCVRGCCGGD